MSARAQWQSIVVTRISDRPTRLLQARNTKKCSFSDCPRMAVPSSAAIVELSLSSIITSGNHAATSILGITLRSYAVESFCFLPTAFRLQPLELSELRGYFHSWNNQQIHALFAYYSCRSESDAVTSYFVMAASCTPVIRTT